MTAQFNFYCLRNLGSAFFESLRNYKVEEVVGGQGDLYGDFAPLPFLKKMRYELHMRN